MHVFWAMVVALGCADDASPTGGQSAGGAGSGGQSAGGESTGAASAGGNGGKAAGGEAAGGEAAGGSGPITACEAYCAASAGCDPNPNCVAMCVAGTTDACTAAWDPYTYCLAESYDASACEWRFHECEPEAEAVGACLDSYVCLSQCEDTPDGCSCTHSCVGTDFGWDCTVDGANVTCACSHDGVPTFECSDVTGSCSTLLHAECCLSG